MRSRISRAAVIAAAVVAVSASLAFAAHPLKSTVYAGLTAKESDMIQLTVSKNGKTLKATIPVIPLYCQGGGPPEEEVTKSVRIHRDGRFSGVIHYKFQGKESFEAFFSGRFTTKRLVKGHLRSDYPNAKSCSGTTTFELTPNATLL
jgi:hypothetical protein